MPGPFQCKYIYKKKIFIFLKLRIRCLLIKSSITIINNHDISLLYFGSKDNTLCLGILTVHLPHIHLDGLTGEHRGREAAFNRLEACGLVIGQGLDDEMSAGTVGTETVKDGLGEPDCRG